MIPFQDQAAIFALIGRIFIHELDQEAIEILKDPDISSIFEKLHTGFKDYVKNTIWDEERLEQLATDYCHLFILPHSGLSLRISGWLPGYESANMRQLENVINHLEFDLSTITGSFQNIPNDHLGLLLYLISSIYSSEDPEIRKLGLPLTELALTPWVSRFVEKLSASTENPIYLASGKLLLELLDHETHRESNRVGPD